MPGAGVLCMVDHPAAAPVAAPDHCLPVRITGVRFARARVRPIIG
ncbi:MULTISPECIES: hypothetical protein [unclassified Minwuia]|nr:MULTISPECIES: hypothetical protein [unclassified Minwuia]